MNYTQRNIEKARERIRLAQICTHEEWGWAGIWEWCLRCGTSLRMLQEQKRNHGSA